MKKPNLFLVGQPKSGTTALHGFLGQHPDIYMSEVKAPYFFCKDFHQESDRYHGRRLFFDIRNLETYLNLFTKAGSEKIVGESSDHALYSEVVADEIHQFNPDAKIIILLREPVDFLYSLHGQYVRLTYEHEADFVSALALEPLRRQHQQISSRVMCPSFLYYSQRVHYYEQVKRFYDKFRPENIKIMLYEDFRADNDRSYREILSFLGVDANFSAQYKSVNVGKDIRFKHLNYLLNHQVLKNAVRQAISPKLYDLLIEKVVANLLWQQSSQQLSPETKRQLMPKFRAEVLKISQLTGIDLEQRWGYDRSGY
ncbi:MAG: sulfotransferase [Cyanophyceae cyanobacterium]